jgi:hypothetical protein
MDMAAGATWRPPYVVFFLFSDVAAVGPLTAQGEKITQSTTRLP